MWNSMTEEQRDLVRAKARWEHMGLWAVLTEWPSLLRPTGIGSNPTMKVRAARKLA